MAHGDTWSFIDSRPLRFPYVYSYRSTEVLATERVDTTSEGYVGVSTLVVGNVSRVEDSDAGVRIIVPEAADMRASPEALLSTLDGSRELLGVSPDEPSIELFVAPSPVRRGGRMNVVDSRYRGDMWVHEDEDNRGVSNVWIHEYVHTQQRFELEPEMRWFTESSAEYYESLHPLHLNDATFGAFHDELTRTRARGTLSEQETWSLETPYDQGSRLLAALDAQIRCDSNGASSLTAVFTRMNRHQGRISLQDFTGMVVAESGNESLTGWVERYATTDSLPRVPDTPGKFAQVGQGDSDGDGIPDRREIEIETNPFDVDTDGDGLSDGEELSTYGTPPRTSDADGDGLVDGDEIQLGTDLSDADTDGDGLSDGEEYNTYQTPPKTSDADDDGLSDGDEIHAYGTSPNAIDSDEDSYADPVEIAIGTSPTSQTALHEFLLATGDIGCILDYYGIAETGEGCFGQTTA